MTVILFIAIVALGIALERLVTRVRRLEHHVVELQDRLIRLDPGLTTAPRARREEDDAEERTEPVEQRHTATVVRAQAAAAPPPAIQLPDTPIPPEPVEPVDAPAGDRDTIPARESARIGFENIVGAKLPIWIGGAALVLSAFFLVR